MPKTLNIELSDELYAALEMFSILTLQPPNEYAAEVIMEGIVQDTNRFFNSTDETVKMGRENILKYIGKEKQI